MHVGIILDGNRRFAKEQNKFPWSGHKSGAEKLSDVLKWLPDFGVSQVTLYVFSTENFKRDPKEVEELFSLCITYFAKLKKEAPKDVKMRFIGDLERFPDDLQTLCKEIEEQTNDNSPRVVNFAFGYGGRDEIIHAVQQIIKKNIAAEDVTSKIIQDNLYLQDEPDLIIRTGGAQRTSNFLPWQSIYSEWFFIDTLFPAITKDELAGIFEEFSQRKRNFGR
ncbi:MAG: undecaprenyl diphosphate synthase [Candidatus Woesearchaeota archaeon]|jgi:undecaprenyl diphosphate synthase